MAVHESTIPLDETQGSTIAIAVPSEPIFAIETPSALTGTALTFEYTPDNGTTWKQVFKEGSVYSLTVAANRFIVVDPIVFKGLTQIRPVSGSEEEAARVIRFHTAVK
jgi:hypothetical protein